MLLAVECVVPAVERLLALHDPVLELLNLLLALLLVGLGLLLQLQNLLASLYERGLLRRLRVMPRVARDAFRLLPCILDGLVGLLDL